jgi:hypothetical protein
VSYKNSNGDRKRHRTDSLLPGYNLGALSDFCWWILPFHKLNIPRIAELAWKFRHPATGYTDKIDILQLGFADVPRVRCCLTAVVANISLVYLNWITKVTKLFSRFATGITHMNFVSHDFLPFQSQ